MLLTADEQMPRTIHFFIVTVKPTMRDFLSASSLSDLKEIGCKSVWLVYISPLFRPIEQLLAFKIVKIHPHPVTFSLRFFKSDRLPGA